ncbi:MAG: hypothetical protein Q9164_003218 [Protoblastenia rupestris]
MDDDLPGSCPPQEITPSTSDQGLIATEVGIDSTPKLVVESVRQNSVKRMIKEKARPKKMNRHKILPPEILETILYLTDPESFASLVLVDHAWREASQTPHLYAYHLSRCPSYSLNNLVADAGPFTDDSLPHLKAKFAQEVRRNLFEAYLQPRRTVVTLVSTTTSSSSACPGGEAFDFSFSPNGHWVLALSSSRIYVIDTVSPRISVQRELKVLRRPVSAAILDHGSTLAVLSSDHQVNVYDLANLKIRRIRSISLDHSPRAIALTPKGEVLAAAFEGGVELHSLIPNAGEQDRRTVKCDRIDSLTFSNDGTVLLGTTRNTKSPNTVILTAPYYTEDNQNLPVADQISHIWTSQIIFPNSSRDCSHAALLSNRSDGDANWAFTFDRVFESFRAVRTDDLRNGTTYFTGPRRPRRVEATQSKHKLTPCTLPAPSSGGELVAAGFWGKDVWLYGVPEGLDVAQISQIDDPSSSSGPSTPASIPQSPARSLTRGEAAELTTLPKWQVLVDKYRNVFAKGRQVAEIPGVTALCWVKQNQRSDLKSLKERLIFVAPGGIATDPELEQDGFASVDGGRLILLDFDRRPDDGGVEELRFEVGNDAPELLEEERRDLDTEVELARRRTIRKDLRPVSTVIDALASSSSIPPLPPPAHAAANINAATTPTAVPHPETGLSPEPVPASESPGLSVEEATAAFDGPYSHTQPRSRTSLYRSATAVAANRQRNPPRIVEEARVEYRRPGDRTELPHESDADNWVPPPPPYAPKADIPLPDHLRRSIMPKTTDPLSHPQSSSDRPRRAGTLHGGGDSRRVSSLPERLSVNHRQGPPSNLIDVRSLSESLDQLSGPVSPLSCTGFALGDETSELSMTSRRPSTASTRRPMSAYVDRMASSLRRRSSTHLNASVSSENLSQMSYRPANGHSVSLPPSPTHDERPMSPITLTGANLQQRLEYPLPPAPHNPTSAQDDLSAIPMMPSAQQLSNLQNRYRQPPPPQPRRSLPRGLTTSGDRIPAPPRGALGAAGSSTSPALYTPARAFSNRNSLARSSPALLRPTPRRLDTIESVSSFVSRTGSRSRSRGLRSAGSATATAGGRRSQSVGPALVLDRVPTGHDGRVRKGWLGGRKGRKVKGKEKRVVVGGESEREFENGEETRGGKCILM